MKQPGYSIYIAIAMGLASLVCSIQGHAAATPPRARPGQKAPSTQATKPIVRQLTKTKATSTATKAATKGTKAASQPASQKATKKAAKHPIPTKRIAPTSRRKAGPIKRTPTSRRIAPTSQRAIVPTKRAPKNALPKVEPRRRAPARPTKPKKPAKRSLQRRAPRPKAPARRRLSPKRDRAWWHLSYLIDWGIALGFAGAAVGIYLIEPPVRPFQTNDPTISLPNKPDTVSEGLMAGLAIGTPLITFALAQIWLRSGHDFHHAALGLAEAVSTTFLLTTLLKVTVGRLRPDFLDRCKPNADLNCTGDPAEVTKGRKSFPSGHSSFAFAGGTFLALYLWGKLKPFNGQGAFWKVPVILLPVAGATLIAVSRVTDNRHHWEDVLIGALIGSASACLGYFLNFPAPWSKETSPRRRTRIAVLPLVSPDRVGMALQGSF